MRSNTVRPEIVNRTEHLPHPGFKVCFGEVDPYRRWPAVPQKPSRDPDFRRFPPMLNWSVDISPSFTQNNHYVL